MTRLNDKLTVNRVDAEGLTSSNSESTRGSGQGANALSSPGATPSVATSTTAPDAAASPLGTVTADDPGVLRALEWMASFARKYDVRKVSSYQSGVVGSGNTPFYAGKAAMRLLHVAQLKDLKKYAPTMDIGIGLIPAPLDGEYPNGWIGGWSLAVPRNKTVRPEAFEFIKWMCTSDEATNIESIELEQFPAYRLSPCFEQTRKDPKRGVFYDILANAKHVRTLMPVQGYYMERIGRAMDEVFYGGADPAAALARARIDVSARLQSVADELAHHAEAAK